MENNYNDTLKNCNESFDKLLNRLNYLDLKLEMMIVQMEQKNLQYKIEGLMRNEHS